MLRRGLTPQRVVHAKVQERLSISTRDDTAAYQVTLFHFYRPYISGGGVSNGRIIREQTRYGMVGTHSRT